MEETLKRIIKTMSRSGGTLSVLMMDIDHFKKYNDTYGHSMGDACLKSVADVFADCIMRADDFVARYGGEEFVVVLPNTDEEGARVIADKLHESIREQQIPHKASDTAHYVTISIGGITGKVDHSQCEENYIKRADEMLYASKQKGRNQSTICLLREEQQ
jgi:diguanylate cyclase (GGDEF)-like protein